MLLRPKRFEPQDFALGHGGQPAAFIAFGSLIVFALGRDLIRRQMAFELHHRTGRSEEVVTRSDVNARLVEDRWHHLRSHEPLPDQLIKLEKIVAQIWLHVRRLACHVCRTYRFVRILRFLLRLVEVGLLRQVIRPELRPDQLTHLPQRLIGHAHRIGAHVRNQRNRAFIAQFHAFIQPLRQHHGALRCIAQTVVCRLLQLRGRERRLRVAPLLLLRNFGNLPTRFFYRRDDRVGFRLRMDFDVFAFVFGELGLERRRLGRGKLGMQRPVLHRRERANLAFSLHDQPQRHGLHASSRQAPPHLVPQQRRNLVAHQAIQHAPRLLRIHKVLVDLPGMLEGRANCSRRDLVEHYPENMIPP